MSETAEKTQVFEINPEMFLLQNNFNIEVYKTTQSLITALAALQQFDGSSPCRFISEMDVSFVVMDASFVDKRVIHTDSKESTEQLIYRGWIASIIRTWNSYRSQMAKRGFSNGMKSKQIVIIKSVMGDLNKIRNSLTHGSDIAGGDPKCNVKNCEKLKWFKCGDKLTLAISHVFDFLYHLGLLQGKFTKATQEADAEQSNLQLMWLIKGEAVLKSFGRKVVSLEDTGITKGKPDIRYIHVLFDNGVFGSFYPREFGINSFHDVKVVEGNLKFDNKTLIKAKELYRVLVKRFPKSNYPSLEFGFKFTAEGSIAKVKYPKPEELPVKYYEAGAIWIDFDTEKGSLTDNRETHYGRK